MGDSVAGVTSDADRGSGDKVGVKINGSNDNTFTESNQENGPSKDANGNAEEAGNSPTKSEKSITSVNANGEGDSCKVHSSPDHFSTADEGTGDAEGIETEEDSCISTDPEGATSNTDSDDEDDCIGSSDRHCMATLEEKQRLRKAEPQLPSTVTVLKTNEGSVVYLVGTAHFSLESQEDVAKTIQETQPDVLLIELCKSRVNILSFDEEVILKESQNMNFEKMMSTIKQNGVVQGIMYLLLLSMSAHLTRQLGMAPGGEFRRAVQEAEKVKGCLIHLGDRPLHITLQRALAALSVWQKLRLAWHMITAKEPISKEEVERCKKQDLLEEMLAEMTGEFPALSEVFVKERDIYLAYSLRLAARPMPCLSAVKGEEPAVVVGVVGIGHVAGIVENWDKVGDRDIPPIMRIPEPSISSKVLKYSIKVSILSLAVWGCWKILPSTVTQRPVEWVTTLWTR
ncbi:traB domain-containing protein-like isoform X2 [Ornithodoros turicata]|uniref:traB domain-containing protein-like isoform X2 n=1 Tax=Ornithodoros turicata TaxID=34597 RepID=UPI0031394409